MDRTYKPILIPVVLILGFILCMMMPFFGEDCIRPRAKGSEPEKVDWRPRIAPETPASDSGDESGGQPEKQLDWALIVVPSEDPAAETGGDDVSDLQAPEPMEHFRDFGEFGESQWPAGTHYVFLTARWCAPCKAVKALIESRPARATVWLIDIDKYPRGAGWFFQRTGQRHIPQLIRVHIDARGNATRLDSWQRGTHPSDFIQ